MSWTVPKLRDRIRQATALILRRNKSCITKLTFTDLIHTHALTSKALNLAYKKWRHTHLWRVDLSTANVISLVRHRNWTLKWHGDEFHSSKAIKLTRNSNSPQHLRSYVYKLFRGKIVLVRTMKAYRRAGGLPPRLPNFGNRWSWVVNFTLRLLYPTPSWGRTSINYWIRR